MIRGALALSATVVASLRQNSVARICSSSVALAGVRPLGPKSRVPDFSVSLGTAVVNGEFKTISAKDYKGKWLIVFFYPLDFTFVCPTEITAFSDRADEFRKLNTELIACSCDSHFSHLAWTQTPRSEGGLGDMQ
ncbi:unnamed protein product, partial [Gongylonema pulchrum]|uniref:thioredoxin-dependent peroxiredoxin n=1 Tax=Gongylonema pulchrum TaxID=637853 RepID=A0A183EU03_9BILA